MKGDTGFFKVLLTELQASSDALFFEQLAGLIERKTARLTYLKRLDLIEWADKYGNDAAKYKIKERDETQKELQLLIGAAQYINDFEEKYAQEHTELLDCISSQYFENRQLEAQVHSLKKDVQILVECIEHDTRHTRDYLTSTLNNLSKNDNETH